MPGAVLGADQNVLPSPYSQSLGERSRWVGCWHAVVFVETEGCLSYFSGRNKVSLSRSVLKMAWRDVAVLGQAFVGDH